MTVTQDSGIIPPPSADNPSAPGGPGAVNPAAMTAEQLAAMLRGGGAGAAATAEAVERHRQAGAPANRDGTVNLVHYTAWLISQIERTGPS